MLLLVVGPPWTTKQKNINHYALRCMRGPPPLNGSTSINSLIFCVTSLNYFQFYSGNLFVLLNWKKNSKIHICLWLWFPFELISYIKINLKWLFDLRNYSWFHIKGTWSVRSFNVDYLSIPLCTGSCAYLFNEIPSTCFDWIIEIIVKPQPKFYFKSPPCPPLPI